VLCHRTFGTLFFVTKQTPQGLLTTSDSNEVHIIISKHDKVDFGGWFSRLTAAIH